MSRFTILGRFPSLNEYTNSNRTNRYKGSKMKRDCQETAFKAILSDKVPKVYKYPIRLKITWYEPNKRRDIDNIIWSTKVILDSLVQARIIEDDSQKYVVGIENEVLVDNKNPRIEVEIVEGSENG